MFMFSYKYWYKEYTNTLKYWFDLQSYEIHLNKRVSKIKFNKH